MTETMVTIDITKPTPTAEELEIAQDIVLEAINDVSGPLWEAVLAHNDNTGRVPLSHLYIAISNLAERCSELDKNPPRH